VHTPPAVRRIVRRRGAAAAVSLTAIGAVLTAGGIAAAAPQPTIAQVQQRLNKLNTEADRVGQQFDQAHQELKAADERLALVNREESRYQGRFDSMRAQVGRIAATAYEEGTLSSSAALLTSGDPQQILNQSSILTELSATNADEMSQFIAATRQLTGAQQAAKRAQEGIAQLKSSLSKRRQSLNKLIGQEKALLAQLTPAQQTTAVPGAGGTTKKVSYTGPTKTQAQKAVAFAFAQIGKPYQWGATGPNSYDCSGLTMSAWAYAGVSIPRISYDQMSELPAVPLDALEPGDILGFAGNSHVGIYVGGGNLIDAPETGEDVEEVALSGWYAQELDGAVQP